jgi:hypothetical protein
MFQKEGGQIDAHTHTKHTERKRLVLTHQYNSPLENVDADHYGADKNDQKKKEEQYVAVDRCPNPPHGISICNNRRVIFVCFWFL